MHGLTRRTYTRFAILLGLLFAATLSAAALIYMLNLDGLRQLARAEVREKAQTANTVLDLKGQSLANFAYDYTYWDDMVAFAASGDRQWAADNIEPALGTYGADAVWVYAPDGRLVYTATTLEGDVASLPTRAGIDLRHLFGRERLVHLFMLTAMGPMEVRGATIHPTDDQDRRTAPRGYLLAGRLWGDAFTQEVARLLGARATLEPVTPATPAKPNDPARYDPDRHVVVYLRSLYSWTGELIALLRIETPVDVLRGIYAGVMIQIAFNVSFALVALGVLYGAITRWVTTPLRRLEGSMRAHDPAALGHLVHDRGEFGELARIVVRTFEQEAQLAYSAFHDALTRLPNRAYFMDRLTQAIHRGQRHPDYRFAVLFLDLDEFKVVNDSLGHAAGDQLLVGVAERLRTCVRAHDTVARLGGDEFTILLDGIRDPAEATAVADRIHVELMLPLHVEGKDVFTSASIGIAYSDRGTATADEFLRNADLALYRAKALGKARHEVFDPAMHTVALARLELETELRQALQRDEFILHFQPVVAVPSRTLVGFEALLRWQHPRRGLVLPGEFVRVAEEVGLAHAIQDVALRRACAQLRTWQQQFPGAAHLTVSVNITSRQFARPDLHEHVAAILAETGLDAQALRLEITESVITDHAESRAARLARLRDLRVHLDVDDFGTGRSSLSDLWDLRPERLKVDETLVARLMTDPGHVEIVRAIVAFAHRMGTAVVAEGIETPQQLDLLAAMPVEFAQGALLAPPLDADAVTSLLGSTQAGAASWLRDA